MQPARAQRIFHPTDLQAASLRLAPRGEEEGKLESSDGRRRDVVSRAAVRPDHSPRPDT